MSSPRAATKPAHKAAPKAAARKARPKAVARTTKPAASPQNGASGEALRLAAEIEKSLAAGDADLLSAEALQALMAATCKAYAARVEAGNPTAALAQRTTVSPTDVMVTASGLLRAVNLAVFELGMWQSWTGR
jgi:hypothetical protein